MNRRLAAALTAAVVASPAYAACGSEYFQYDNLYCQLWRMSPSDVDLSKRIDFVIRLEAEGGNCEKLAPAAVLKTDDTEQDMDGPLGGLSAWDSVLFGDQGGDWSRLRYGGRWTGEYFSGNHFYTDKTIPVPLNNSKAGFVFFPRSGWFYQHIGLEIQGGSCIR